MFQMCPKKIQFISDEIPTINELLWKLYYLYNQARDLVIITPKFKSIVV